jgi:Ala-tRNA(Pro) deacylase
VTPFGILNDESHAVQVHIDAYFQGRTISVHPNENNATVYLNADVLVDILREHGNTVSYLDFEK